MRDRFEKLQAEFNTLFERLKTTSDTNEKIALFKSINRVLREADQLIEWQSARTFDVQARLHSFYSDES